MGKDSSAKRDSNAQAVEPKGGDGCTDLQATLRKACEEAVEVCIYSLDDTAYANEYQIRKFTDIIERHLTAVFEALRDSVIEKCAKVADDEYELDKDTPCEEGHREFEL